MRMHHNSDTAATGGRHAEPHAPPPPRKFAKWAGRRGRRLIQSQALPLRSIAFLIRYKKTNFGLYFRPKAPNRTTFRVGIKSTQNQHILHCFLPLSQHSTFIRGRVLKAAQSLRSLAPRAHSLRSHTLFKANNHSVRCAHCAAARRHHRTIPHFPIN